MNGRKLLVGVTGGIAAYKTAALVSQLVQAGADVSVVMTRSAQEFIGRATFAALTARAVATDVFDDRFPLGAHIMLAQNNELLCVAPASADFLGKAANGLADDLLSTLYMCFQGTVLLAPAMNSEMWTKNSVQRNVQTLTNDGVNFVGPDDGWLSCRQTGTGRMAAPDAIFTSIKQLLNVSSSS